VVGRFDAPVHSGGIVLLKYAYPWFGLAKQTATETDTDSARTLLAESEQVSVARGPGQKPARVHVQGQLRTSGASSKCAAYQSLQDVGSLVDQTIESVPKRGR
jgi:hypothetical protein